MAINRRQKSLKSGRPPFSKPSYSSKSTGLGSSKTTRIIIKRHHNRLKAHSQALASGDVPAAKIIANTIEEDGGLEKYQRASQTGQMSERGGDTSKVLVEWLDECGATGHQSKLRVLEIGCLSVDNSISRVKGVEMVRIDLRSTHPQILQQDFMKRSPPSDQEERFDIVSLSLVLNYVPNIQERGAMLFHTTQFLAPSIAADEHKGPSSLAVLFLTLPLPCISNSRYLTFKRLEHIMSGMGYRLLKSKESTKIHYSLWDLALKVDRPKPCLKSEVNPGKGRNNFCMVVK